MKSNKNKTNNNTKNDNNKNDSNNLNSNDEILSKLPLFSLEVYEDDYFKELILEPLSLLSSGDVIVVSSPIKKKQQKDNNNKNNNLEGNNDYSDDDDDDDGDNEIGETSNINNNNNNDKYYCPFCKKRFQTEQTWNTHINSSKHLNSIKEQKKKTTSLNLTPTKSSPNKNNNNNNNGSSSSSSSTINSKDNEFILEQLNLIQQSIKIKNSKPNLACKNLFNIAKSYSSKQYIRDSAKTLYIILDILKSQQQKEEEPSSSSSPSSLNNIFQSVSLSFKTNLYIARLTRLFQMNLSEFHFIQSFNQLSLISIDDLNKYEQLISISSNPINLYKIFLNKLSIIIKEKKNEESQQQQQQKEEEEKDNEKILTILNYLNEISGGLCYCKVNFKSIIIYILSTCISYKFKFYKESLQSNQRALKLLLSLKQYPWSIDLHLNNILILLKLKKQQKQQQQQQQQQQQLQEEQQQPSSQKIQQQNNDQKINLNELNNLIKFNFIQIFKYCFITQDKIRLKEIIMENETISKIFKIPSFENDDQLICLKNLSIFYLQDDFKQIDQLKDQFEHLIFTNKEFLFIFNQLLLINNNKLN